jgi:hypothetical protein
MAQHKTSMKIERGSVDLQSKGERIKFVFSADDEKLGELHVSAATVAFKPRGKHKMKKWSITQFVKLLEDLS